jgi:hypothetical protein
MKKEIVGRWRFTAMDQWDLDFIDLVEEGNITFAQKGLGSFAFGAVTAQVDWRFESAAGKIEFTWEGSDEGDPICGRGWAIAEGDKLKGRLYSHFGDESGFEARKGNLRSSRRSQ